MLQCVRCIDGLPISLQTAYLPLKYFPKIEIDFKSGSLSEYIDAFKLLPTYFETKIVLKNS